MKLVYQILLVFALQGTAFAQDLSSIRLPDGFKIQLYAEGIPGVRFMTLSPQGDLMASIPSRGQVILLPDRDHNGRADARKVFADGLDRPHGLAWNKGELYVAETGAVVRLLDRNRDGVSDSRKTITRNLPAGGGHWTRTLGFGPDGWMYVSVGSTCNVCIEKDPRRASIIRMRPDGSRQQVYARGLRNAVGFDWHPLTEALWATENGRDNLGDNLPPDELNRIVEGGDYGWPYCYGRRVVDPEYGNSMRCQKTIAAAFEFPAHSASLGMTFYQGRMFPKQYLYDAFVAFHGSWNRSRKTGYTVVRVRFQNGNPVAVQDFATGWLKNERAWGRPVDVQVSPDGALFVSDDAGGRIYRIYYARP